MIKTYEEFKGYCEVSEFAKSLKIGDFFKYENDDRYIAEVVDKYKDISLTIKMILYYNEFSKEWRITNDRGRLYLNMDLISDCASPITKEDMKEIGHFLNAKKFNI